MKKTKPEKNKEESCGGTEAQKWPIREVTSEKQNLQKHIGERHKSGPGWSEGLCPKILWRGWENTVVIKRVKSEKENLKTILVTEQMNGVSWKIWSNSMMLHVSIMKTNSLEIQDLTIAWCRCWWCTLYMARNVLSRSRGTHVGSFSSLNKACSLQFTFRTALI